MKSSVAALVLFLVVTSPSLASDLQGDLLAIERNAWTAWAKRDGQAFSELVTEDSVQAVAGAGVTMGRAKIMADVSSHDCEVKSFDFQDARLRQPVPDVAVLSYTATQDAVCGAEKLPARVYVTSVYVRQGGRWRTMSYQETPIK